MELLFGDSKDILPILYPEVIMIDTMYKNRKKTALVKNNMRLVRDIVGPDSDYIDLLKVALNCATNRVVLKQPRYAEPIKEIRKCICRFAIIFPIPLFIMKIILGGRSQLVKGGLRLKVDKLLNSGFKFKYPTISSFLSNK